MKKKSINRLLSLALAMVMAFGSPMAVYAEETTTVAVEEVAEETVEVSTEEAVSETEAVTTQEEFVEETTVEETTEVSTEEITESATEEKTVADAEIAAQLKKHGFKAMSLTGRMIDEKKTHTAVSSSLSEMEAGKDYVENEILYIADSEEEAKQIAECYGGTLGEYNYGVATAVISASVEVAIKMSANPKVELPAVYPNIIYSINTEDTDATLKEAVLVDEADVNREDEVAELVDSEDLELPHEDEHLYATAPNDTYYDSQWHHNTMKTVEAWNATKGAGVTVAVIDSGIDYEHPDLKNNIVGYTDTTGTSNGRDDNGHGTHCAGIIAAQANNGVGVSGVAPEAKIYSIKALKANGSGSGYDIIEAINLATEMNVDVISMSLGGIYWDKLEEDAIKKAVKKGIVVVAAAGNEATVQKSYPAAYADVISVAATNQSNRLTDFSNYGKWVDIAAPGYNILSTVPTNFTKSNWTSPATGYAYMSGTSMACPAVAGVVALMLSNNESLRKNNTKANVTKVTNTLVNSAVLDGATSYWYAYDDPNYTYPLTNAETTTFAVDTAKAEVPVITFSSAPNNKNVVLAGSDQYFTLTTTTPHSKIYYTTNGKKPTVKTGTLYTGKVSMPKSGKVTIQAITVVGSKTSEVFKKTYTFDAKAKALSSTCNKNMNVAIGKNIKLSVNVAPDYARVKKLTWTSSDTTKMIKVDKNGKVTCKGTTAPGTTAVITATTTDGSNLSYTFNVTAVVDKATKVTLNATELKMLTFTNDIREYEDFGVALKEGYVSSYQLVAACEGTATTQFTYKTSNAKVATVDAYGKITPIGSGTAKITATANDGSGKSAVCKVTVVNPVFDIYLSSSTGFSGESDYIPIGTGYSIKLKPEINYGLTGYAYKAKNKNLKWTSDNQLVTVNQEGKVTCNKYAIPGTMVTITATAADGFGTSKSVTFKVTDGITKMTYKGKSSVSEWMQYADPYPYYDYLDLLTVTTRGGGEEYDFYTYFNVTNSNPDSVYRVYDYEYEATVLYAVKPGKAKLTYTARDGSNKKFTANVEVIKY